MREVGATWLRRVILAAWAASALTACGPRTPLWGPDAPRNGAGLPIDPHTGLVLPGAPSQEDGMR